jgi:hypothetical protein
MSHRQASRSKHPCRCFGARLGDVGRHLAVLRTRPPTTVSGLACTGCWAAIRSPLVAGPPQVAEARASCNARTARRPPRCQPRAHSHAVDAVRDG